ncbi:amino acid ABC transporter ATP-binding protein [Micromonospora carbonacea]|uniref:Polar amino acid transport system ATP-binding protein n=1 Tax=Micromonospora carbonacea TaxID=47853 RepID=A0A1C5ATW5_9ACTN|nr:amino acid ABC transporter ATP-binding protein [Micromonospora carbonacea]SCF48675.1 polar amino acid transport system ATP-binding protein [Micromonospora carbonacea]
MNSTPSPVLSVAGLDKSYGERKILNGISLDVNCGETLVLIGASGSGKSTLLRCMGLLDPFEAGTVSLNGEVIATGGGHRRHESRAESRRRANFGFVFQQFNLFGHRTALENVMEGPRVVRGMGKAAARKLSVELLERVGVGHRLHAAVPEMSGGEQQRVAIARALAMEPQCLLLDEPTSALDPELVAEVLDVVAQLAQEGTTMVIVTHEMGFAYEAADRVVFMCNGTVHEQGPARAVLDSPSTTALKSFLRRFHYASFPSTPQPGGAVLTPALDPH